MSVGTNDAALAQMLEKHQMSYVKRGLLAGILSGMTWGLQGVLLWSFVLMSSAFVAPYLFADSIWPGLVAALACAALHDFIASLWILLLDAVTGRIKEIPRALKTKPGRLAIFACIFGGPLGMGGYVIGMYLANATVALAISAIYPAIGALLGRIVLKERINVRVWIGIAACLVGAVFVALPDGPSALIESFKSGNAGGMNFYIGCLFALGPAIGWAAEGVISCFGMDMIDPDIAIWIREFFSSAIAMFTTVLVVSIIAAGVVGNVYVTDNVASHVSYTTHWYLGWQVFFTSFTKLDTLIWIIIAAASGGFSYVFWYRALNMIGTGRAMAFNVTYALWSVPAGLLCQPIAKTFLGYDTGYASLVTGTVLFGVALVTVGAILVVVNPKELMKLRNN